MHGRRDRPLAKEKATDPNRDRTEVCDLIPVRFQGMTPVSDGDKKDPWKFDSPEVGCTIGAPSAWLQEPVQAQRFNLVSKRWYPRHGSPGMDASLQRG